MSREGYQVPTAAGQTMGLSAPKGFNDVNDSGNMHYLCGDCGIKTTLRRTDPVRCKECGCRVLYKERTKR